MKFFKVVFASMVGFIFASILLTVISLLIVAGIVGGMSEEKVTKVEPNSLLHVKFSGEIKDRAAKNPFNNFDFGSFESKRAIGLDEILKNIEKAKDDENIKGIYIDVASVPAGMATIEEIRNALLDFKESGKFIVSYSEIYTQKAYYLASVADEIWLNPQGLLEWRGFGAELMFFKNMLEKLEVEPQVIRHGKFKSAIEPFILEKMSEANREQTEKYVFSLWDHYVDGIAASRGLTAEKLNEIADQALIQKAKDAVDQKLADKLMFKDEVIAELKTKAGIEEDKKLKTVSIAAYTNAKVEKENHEISKDKIAVVYALGGIESGNGDDETIGSERISKAIRKARKDENVKAIVLRVNSPGGSALASDVIWREVVLTSEVKPIIASMGDVAASGGYYISCAADTILASPNTITGSIGVFGLLPNMQGLFNNKFGITFDNVKTNKFSDLGSVFRALTEEERAIIQKGVDDIYIDFITKVADGRGLTVDQVDSIGQGRVWSGVDALDLGLVDLMGGLDDAIAIAAEKAKIEDYRVVDYPEQKDPFKQFLSEVSGEGENALIRRQLGEHYEFYKMVEDISEMKGVQARLPYVISIH